MRKLLLLTCLICIGFISFSQEIKVYPSNWWAGMKTNSIQLMLHGNSIGNATVTTTYRGLALKKIHRVENKNYLFIDVVLANNIMPGNANIMVNVNGQKIPVAFPIAARRKGRGETFAQGVRSEDLIYLLMPDRFSNGDETNDRVAGLKDQSLNRDSIYARHGGDLKGVIDHLDYLKELGVTTLWMTPVLQNDMPDRTEHGYAITDHYTVEPRFGGETMYKKLSDELHQRGMKLVQDAVYNHVGLYHFTVQDMPMKDWLNQWPSYTNTTYKDQVLFDPYASQKDKNQMSNGWFTRMMPDLNQNNPYVANFLIQHAIWSVENFGVDGWRIDTYIYNDLNFMNRCNAALYNEYPKMTMFGETWVHGVISQAYFTKNKLDVPFKSNLTGVTDFQTNLYGIAPAMNQPFGWTEGVNKLYTTLADDVVYENAYNNVNFLDNHDMTRFFTQVGENITKMKTALTWLLTARGIPELYYGTEILMTGSTSPYDGNVRLDFKGGWKNDTENKFIASGRTANENEVFNLVKTLADYRKKSSALTTGKLKQFVPQDGLYVYFRYDDQQTIMCIMNTDTKERTVNFSDYNEQVSSFSKAKNILTSEVTNLSQPYKIGSYNMLVLELIK